MDIVKAFSCFWKTFFLFSFPWEPERRKENEKKEELLSPLPSLSDERAGKRSKKVILLWLCYFCLSFSLFSISFVSKLWNSKSVYGGGLDVSTPHISVSPYPLPFRIFLKIMSIMEAWFVKLNWCRGCVQPFITNVKNAEVWLEHYPIKRRITLRE